MSNSFDTVKISSHGEFIDEPLFIYQRLEREIANYITFNVYFRGNIGNIVIPRCNTLSDDCRIKGDKYCKSDIGKQDFYKNMEIKFKNSRIIGAKVLGCDVDKIPDLLLSIDDNDFPCGYALYNNDVPLTKVDGDTCIELKSFIHNGVTLDNINLSQVLELIYNQMEVKRGTIDIYISACLYIQQSQLENIIKNYWQWFDCNNSTINQGYSKDIALVNEKIRQLKLSVGHCEGTLEDITAMKNDNEIGFFIDLLGNIKIKEGFGDYVYQYLSLNDQGLDRLGEYIDQYMEDNNLITDEDKLKELSDKISDGLIEQFNKQYQTTQEYQATQEQEDKIRSDIHYLTNELTKFKSRYGHLTRAIQKCDNKKKTRKKLTRTNRLRYAPYGGQNGDKKKKNTLFKNLKKGAFTRMAKYHGYKDTIKFAQLVMKRHRKGIKKLPNGKRITSLMVKRANFAVNFGSNNKKTKKKTIKRRY